MTQITRADESALRRSVPALAVLRLAFATLMVTRAGESRLVGARELALGLGALDAARRGAPVSGWVGAMAIADGSDAAVFAGHALTTDRLADPGARRKAWVLAAVAASGLLAEGLTAYALRRSGD